GLINAIEVVEDLTILQRSVTVLSRLNVDLRSHAKVLIEHDVAADTEEEAIHASGSLAVSVTAVRRAGAEGVRRRQIVDALAVGFVPRGAEAHADIHRALRAGQ